VATDSKIQRIDDAIIIRNSHENIYVNCETLSS
jgi:hypothetical protein